MKAFSKKGEIIFMAAAFILLGGGILTSFFTDRILTVLPGFLEEHVFHRTFSHEAYRSTMVSLLQFPVFIAVVFSTLFFAKISDKCKSTLILFCTALVMLTLAVISYTHAKDFIDQDLSSEILFSKECFDRGTFWPRSWFYSMEFRFLNTQLYTAPLFLFTKNLSFIRAAQAVLSEVLLWISTYFILHELKIEKLWIKLLCCLLAISPVSWAFFCFVQEGSYYIPHIAFSFFYLGLFLSLAYNRPKSKRKENALLAVFFALAFLSGLSTIRYILNFTFPLAAILLYNRIKEFLRKDESFSLRGFFLEDRPLKISVYALFFSGFGYVLNSTVFTALFTFKNMNKVRFLSLSEIRLDDIISMIVNVAGYNGNVSFSTPGGAANVLLLIVSIFTAVVLAEMYRQNLPTHEKIFLQFTLFMAAFSLYTNVLIEMVERYLTMVMIYFLPFLALAVQNKNILPLKKWILASSAAVLILTNAFICFGRMQTENRSAEVQRLSEFLKQGGYEFGYAFSNTANPVWFCSDGKIDVVQIEDENNAEVRVLPEKFKVRKWLGPKKYLDKNYYKGGKRVFFALKKDEFDLSEKKVLEKGRLVYDNGYYLVFDYGSPADFIAAFE